MIYRTRFGKVNIIVKDGAVSGVKIAHAGAKAEPPSTGCALTAQVITQLEEYFAGERKEFELPLYLEGTQFQRAVWNALKDIPYGETRSYKQVAQAVGRPKACRAVGMANNANPVWIIVPCHRVIGSDGSLTGYGGGLPMKEKLLNLERRYR